MIGAELKIEKIDDVPQAQTVRHIPDNAGKKEDPTDPQDTALKLLSDHDKHREGNKAENDEKPVAIVKHSECRPGVIDMRE